MYEYRQSPTHPSQVRNEAVSINAPIPICSPAIMRDHPNFSGSIPLSRRISWDAGSNSDMQ